MRVSSFIASLLFILSGCELPPKNEMEASRRSSADAKPLNIENEEYVMVTTAVTMPIMDHDKRIQAMGKKMNVRFD